MQSSKAILDRAIAQLHDMIQHGEQAGFPLFARLQLLAVVGLLAEARLELEAALKDETSAAVTPASKVEADSA